MMIAIPRRRISDYDARLRSLASLTVVVFVWASMLVVALGLVYRYGTRTLPQYDEVWALYDSGPGIHIDWLWKTWAEHRIPLAKLIWKGVLQLTNYDFRAGNFLTVLGLSSTAGLMLWTAKKIRGRTILADAFFPLAILNVGQAQVFLWWWQVNHVLAPILATVLLSVVVVRSEQLRLADVRWIGVGLIVLVLCGPGGLPYVAVFATWLAVWTAANWRSFSPQKRQQSVWVFMPTLIALALMGLYFVNYTPYFPINDPSSIPSWPPPAGMRDTAIATLQVLGMSLGIATKPHAELCGFAIFAVGLATIAMLIWRALKYSDDQLRTLGLMLFLATAAVLVFVIARSRAGMGLDYIYQGHYFVTVMPALCCMYLVWEIQGGVVGRLVQFGLVAAIAVLFPLNLVAAIQIGQDVRQRTAAFEHDVRNGIPASVLAERHFASDLVPRAEKLAVILKDYKAHSIGIFKEIRDDPAASTEEVDVAVAILDQVVWRDGIASLTAQSGPAGSLTWKLTHPRYVYAIRIYYAYRRATNLWPTLRTYWRNSATEEFNDAAAFFTTVAGPDQATWALIDGKIHTDAKVRTMRKLTVWVDTTIDEFRLYPDSAPCEVRFSSIELLEPAL